MAVVIGGAEKLAPVLKYPGAKWRIVDWILAHMPRHEVYLEPFFGSGAVFFRKPPSKVEILNDLDGRVVNLFRVLRERPGELAAVVELTPWSRAEYYRTLDEPDTGDELEDARRFLVRCWQANQSNLDHRSGWRIEYAGAVGTPYAHQWARLPRRIAASAERLRGAHIEHAGALDVIARYSRALIYADPPYVHSARLGRVYGREMDDADHEGLLSALAAHEGPVLLSGYRCALYDDLLRPAGWSSRYATAYANNGATREEVLWINPAAVEAIDGRLF